MAADTVPRCSLCEKRAIYLDRVMRTHLCGTHLKETVEKRVLDRIRTAGDLPGTLGIAFSGGKDSTALLVSVVSLGNVIPAKIVALTVDEGISGYREDTIRHAMKVCQALGVEHHIISFRDVFGKSLDQFMTESSRRPCTVCGILRRRSLEILAEQLNVRLIATGHNQDDHAQTTLMNAFSADIKKVFAGTGKAERFARRIKPFASVSEREVSLYAILAGLFRELPECPYAGNSLRGEVRRLLITCEQAHPGSIRNAAEIEEKIRDQLKGKVSSIPLTECRICGWPGSGEICQVCTMMGPDWISRNGSQHR
jgi:uncharacterized protein (TIGR00269 family)